MYSTKTSIIFMQDVHLTKQTIRIPFYRFAYVSISRMTSRGLKILRGVERILEQLEALRYYFNATINQPSSFTACRDRLKRLKQAIYGPFSECTPNFLQTVLALDHATEASHCPETIERVRKNIPKKWMFCV